MSNLFLIEGGKQSSDNSELDDLHGKIKDHISRQQEFDWACSRALNRGFKNGLLLGIMLGMFLTGALVLVAAIGKY